MTLTLMFPGQSSRYPGMFSKLIALHRQNAELMQWASDLLGRDLQAHYCGEAGEQAFTRNVDVQVGVFLANHMYLQALEAHGVHAERSLGLSLGEWNHLVHIGALDFAAALRAVAVRGQLYDEGPRGWMAAIQPIDEDALREVVDAAGKLGPVEIVNLNSPRQHVIAGERAAVEAAVELAEDEHFAQTHIIDRNVPMHSSLFAPVGERFAAYLDTLAFAAPRLPYLPNRLARLLHNPSREQLVELLSSHVHAPVRWRDSIEAVISDNPQTVFVEVGPMAVLHNLIHRKWLGNRKYRLDSREDFGAHFSAVAETLRQLQQQRQTSAQGDMSACTAS